MLGLCCCSWNFSSYREQGYSLVSAHMLPIAVFSLIAEHGSRVCASVAWCMGVVAPQQVGPSLSRDQTHIPCISRQFLNHWTTKWTFWPTQYFYSHFTGEETKVQRQQVNCPNLQLWKTQAAGCRSCFDCFEGMARVQRKSQTSLGSQYLTLACTPMRTEETPRAYFCTRMREPSQLPWLHSQGLQR